MAQKKRLPKIFWGRSIEGLKKSRGSSILGRGSSLRMLLLVVKRSQFNQSKRLRSLMSMQIMKHLLASSKEARGATLGLPQTAQPSIPRTKAVAHPDQSVRRISFMETTNRSYPPLLAPSRSQLFPKSLILSKDSLREPRRCLRGRSPIIIRSSISVVVTFRWLPIIRIR